MGKNSHPVEPEEVMAYLDGQLPPQVVQDRSANLGALVWAG